MISQRILDSIVAEAREHVQTGGSRVTVLHMVIAHLADELEKWRRDAYGLPTIAMSDEAKAPLKGYPSAKEATNGH